ncbi:MAG: hypothetical protein ACJA1A_000449 [Saprospiraceae bacterium]|jgi:hypothetical protein|tara:strand:+ start:1109 stop:2560 length:1452 start_codon:yes stop_codon:yes gene_type:complete
MTFTKNLFTVFLFALAIAFVGCKDEDVCEGKQCTDTEILDASTCECKTIITNPCEGIVCSDGEILTAECECVNTGTGEAITETLAGEIKEDKTLTADRFYLLIGKTYVANGAILTIEPGTIIKGTEGTGSLASALVVARGATINACGTAAKPIIFTSTLDNINIGSTSGTNLGKEDRELWGGLIVLGSAPISAKDGDTETQIEGIPADVAYGKYGGDNESDNSGSLCFISIRHGGALIGADNEINGLTLGGVGSGTTINNIEVVANLDDGIEFFGGTVNVTNALVAYQGDDAIDIDMNYSGTIDNVYIIHGGDDTDEAFEIDGPENATYTEGKFTIINATAIAVDTEKTSGADLKSKAQGTLTNVSWSGYKIGKAIAVRASFEISDCSDKDDSYTNALAGNLVITNSELVSSTAKAADVARVYIDAKSDDALELQACLDGTDYQEVMDGAVVAANNTVVTAATKGADVSAFAWTWAAANGLTN